MSTEKKMPYASVRILPIRKSKTGQGFENWFHSSNVSRHLTLTESHQTGIPQAIVFFANGDWYKFSVVNNGVYKITYTQLKNLGIDIDNIDPHNILYLWKWAACFLRPIPNCGGWFTWKCYSCYYESDNHFDAADYILFYGTSQHRWFRILSPNKFSQGWISIRIVFLLFHHNWFGRWKRIQTRNSSSSGARIPSIPLMFMHTMKLTQWNL